MIKVLFVNEVKRKPNLREVTDSDGVRYILSIDSVITSNIRPDREYSESEWNDILLSSDSRIGMDIAIDYLSRGMRTEGEIKLKLKEKKISYRAIDAIINRLIELDYINDKKYAELYINSYSDSRGKIRLRSELYSKGIDKELINNALDNLEDEETACIEVARKYFRGKTLDKKAKESLIRHLLSRGYTYDIVRNAISVIGGDVDDLPDI